MPKFQFRLQNYLELREKLEEQSKLEYGHAAAKAEQERHREAELKAQKQAALNEYRAKASEGSLKPHELERYTSYLRRMDEAIARQHEKVLRAEAKAEEKRLALVEAMKERKALEVLRDKRYSEYQREAQLAEQKVIDEIVSYKYSKRS
jgi:flagellar FliJ protein